MPKEATHDVITVAAPTDVIQLGECLGECGFSLRDRMLGVVLALGLKASFVLQKLFPIKFSAGDRPIRSR